MRKGRLVFDTGGGGGLKQSAGDGIVGCIRLSSGGRRMWSCQALSEASSGGCRRGPGRDTTRGKRVCAKSNRPRDTLTLPRSVGDRFANFCDSPRCNCIWNREGLLGHVRCDRGLPRLLRWVPLWNYFPSEDCKIHATCGDNVLVVGAPLYGCDVAGMTYELSMAWE